MFYIKHNSRNFTVIDCYLKDNDGNNARKDEIIKEIVTSFGNVDHLYINGEFAIEKAIKFKLHSIEYHFRKIMYREV